MIFRTGIYRMGCRQGCISVGWGKDHAVCLGLLGHPRQLFRRLPALWELKTGFLVFQMISIKEMCILIQSLANACVKPSEVDGQRGRRGILHVL